MKTHSKQRKGERWDRKIGRGKEALQKQTMMEGHLSSSVGKHKTYTWKEFSLNNVAKLLFYSPDEGAQ